jgi:hypothetical protein
MLFETILWAAVQQYMTLRQNIDQDNAIAASVFAHKRKLEDEMIQEVGADYLLNDSGPRPRKKRDKDITRNSSLYYDMMETWPGLSERQRDQMYYKNFRMKEAMFNEIYNAIKGQLQCDQTLFLSWHRVFSFGNRD